MKCPNCGSENPSSEPYCQKCASPLERIHKVPMKRRTAIAVYASIGVLIVLLLSVLTMASAPGFGHDHSIEIPAWGVLRIHVIALLGDSITVSCEPEDTVVISVMDPDGIWTYMGGVGTIRPFSETFSVNQSGEWTIVWTNPNEFSVKMSYDVSSSTLDSIRDPLLTEIAWLVAIIVSLIIVLIAVVALVARYLHHLDADLSK